MTDVEVSAYSVYQDVTVGNEGTADSLDKETLAHYKKPAKGMKLELN